jgi:hypothetical protein
MSTVVTLGLVILILAFFGMFLFSRWQLRTIGVALVGIAAVFVGAVVWFSYALERSLEKRNGPKHVFMVTEQRQFLEEAVALEKAVETLPLDGFTNGAWQPAKDGRTAAPDGRPDVYLARNSIYPLRGYLVFTNGTGAEAVVQLSLEGTNLVCHRVVSK